MNQIELVEAKKKMERDAAAALAEIVTDFKEATGCTPENIQVTMHDVSTIGDTWPEHVIGIVETTVPQMTPNKNLEKIDDIRESTVDLISEARIGFAPSPHIMETRKALVDLVNEIDELINQ